MAKNLLSKLISKARKATLIATAVASLGLATCKFCAPGPTPVNYLPEITSTPTTTEINEGEFYSHDVDATDPNGDSLEYSLNVTPSLPSWLSINQDTGLSSGIVPQVDADTVFDIENIVSDGVNPAVKQNYTLTVKNVVVPPEDFLDVSGRLEDCENPGVGRQGVMRIKNPADNSVIGQYNVNGNFSITLDKLVSELPNGVILEVITGIASNPTSFTRIINNLPAGDINSATDLRMNPAIRPTPFYSDFDSDGYADLDKNKNGVIELSEKQDFKEHTGRVNIYDVYSLQKWNHGELPDTIGHPVFKGIEISTDFTTEEQDSIENSFRNSGYPKAGEVNIVRGKNHYLELGWGFIRLSNPGEAPGTYVYEQYGADGYIERFVTNLTHLQATSKGLVNHEIAHGLLFTGHADSDTILALFNSIIKFTSYDNRYSPPERPETFTAADIKESYTIEDPTHAGKELEDNLLGVSF